MHDEPRGRSFPQVVDSLNWMAGRSQSQAPTTPSPMQVEVLSQLEGLVKDQEPKGEAPLPEEALKALLHGSSPYDGAAVNETRASYQAELISIPGDVRQCPLLSQVLPSDVRWPSAFGGEFRADAEGHAGVVRGSASDTLLGPKVEVQSQGL